MENAEFNEIDREMMKIALEEASKAAEIDETPIGAVITRNGEIIAQAHNLRQTEKNALLHAEILCIDEACKKLGGWRLPGCTIYVTLEPCPMCAGAILNARIGRVVYACKDAKSGAFGSVVNLAEYPFNHKPVIENGLCAEESRHLLSEFFKSKRNRIEK